MTTIVIEQYGDFDIPVIKTILYTEQKLKVNKLKQEFNQSLNLNSYHYSELDTITELFIEFLLSKGFKKLDYTSVLFSS